MEPAATFDSRTRDTSTLAASGSGSLRFVLAHHRNLMLGVTAAVVAFSLTSEAPSTVTQLVLLAAAVVAVGLPHGALDHLTGRRLLADHFGRRWWLPFGIGYIGAGIVVAALWILAPLASLVAFLLLSAAHFGWDDPSWIATGAGRYAVLERYAVGSLPILLPILAHPGQVTVIFSWLMPSRIILSVDAVAAGGWLFATMLLPVVAVRGMRLVGGRALDQAAAAELAAIAVLHIVCAPLIAFLTYFCGWHSMRHALELANQLAPGDAAEGLKRFGKAALPLTAVSVAAAVVVAPLLGSVRAQPSEVLATLVFVGLSVLTVPHMGMMAMERRANGHRGSLAGRTRA